MDGKRTGLFVCYLIDKEEGWMEVVAEMLTQAGLWLGDGEH